MAKILGWLTVTGLVLVVVAFAARAGDVSYPAPIFLLCLGALFFLIAGIPWAHTRGKRQLKYSFLGVVGFAAGGTAGLFLGEYFGRTRHMDLGSAIFLLIGGFWFGAILLSVFAILWGMWFHERYGPYGTGHGGKADSK